VSLSYGVVGAQLGQITKSQFCVVQYRIPLARDERDCCGNAEWRMPLVLYPNLKDLSNVNSKISQSKPDVPSIQKAFSYLCKTSLDFLRTFVVSESSRERDHEQCKRR